MKKTLDTFISDKFALFNSLPQPMGLPDLVRTRAWTGLLLLTQATRREDNLTASIVSIAKMLDPIMQGIGKHNRSKYNNLLNPSSIVHNVRPDQDEYMSRVVVVCQPLEYIRQWYFESDQDGPFDLNEYSKAYEVIKAAANKVFEQSIWSV